jgi:hypothetical protein
VRSPGNVSAARFVGGEGDDRASGDARGDPQEHVSQLGAEDVDEGCSAPRTTIAALAITRHDSSRMAILTKNAPLIAPQEGRPASKPFALFSKVESNGGERSPHIVKWLAAIPPARIRTRRPQRISR